MQCYWNTPFWELTEVCQQITYPESASRCFGRVNWTDPFLCCPEAGEEQREEGGEMIKYINMKS